MNISRFFILAPLCMILSATTGCMWSRVKVNDPSIVERSHFVKEGTTHEDDLEEILQAKPTMHIPGRESHTLAYSFSDTKHNGLVLILLNFSRSTTIAETLYIDIDTSTRKVKKVHRPQVPTIEWRFWPFSDR